MASIQKIIIRRRKCLFYTKLKFFCDVQESAL